jgi:hypothetical protein
MKRHSRFAFVLIGAAWLAPLHAANPSASALAVKKVGKPLAGLPAVSVAQLVASPQTYAGKKIRTEGRIAAVCQEKGCWMTLGESARPIRVTFENYGFFVPKDSAGSTATLEGVFKVEKIPEATAKHYAGETPGGKPDGIRGDQQELTIVATGVELSSTPAPRK